MENEITKHCVAKHIKAFYDQAREGRTADFGEPCNYCKYWHNCRGDWLSHLKQVMTDDVKINVGRHC